MNHLMPFRRLIALSVALSLPLPSAAQMRAAVSGRAAAGVPAALPVGTAVSALNPLSARMGVAALPAGAALLPGAHGSVPTATEAAPALGSAQLAVRALRPVDAAPAPAPREGVRAAEPLLSRGQGRSVPGEVAYAQLSEAGRIETGTSRDLSSLYDGAAERSSSAQSGVLSLAPSALRSETRLARGPAAEDLRADAPLEPLGGAVLMAGLSAGRVQRSDLGDRRDREGGAVFEKILWTAAALLGLAALTVPGYLAIETLGGVVIALGALSVLGVMARSLWRFLAGMTLRRGYLTMASIFLSPGVAQLHLMVTTPFQAFALGVLSGLTSLLAVIGLFSSLGAPGRPERRMLIALTTALVGVGAFSALRAWAAGALSQHFMGYFLLPGMFIGMLPLLFALQMHHDED